MQKESEVEIFRESASHRVIQIDRQPPRLISHLLSLQKQKYRETEARSRLADWWLTFSPHFTPFEMWKKYRNKKIQKYKNTKCKVQECKNTKTYKHHKSEEMVFTWRTLAIIQLPHGPKGNLPLGEVIYLFMPKVYISPTNITCVFCIVIKTADCWA